MQHNRIYTFPLNNHRWAVNFSLNLATKLATIMNSYAYKYINKNSILT